MLRTVSHLPARPVRAAGLAAALAAIWQSLARRAGTTAHAAANRARAPRGAKYHDPGPDDRRTRRAGCGLYRRGADRRATGAALGRPRYDHCAADLAVLRAGTPSSERAGCAR